MQLYNSKTQMVQEFVPVDQVVRIYVCGITPYDTTHLGHASLYATFDNLIRYLEWRGIAVRYAQNVTDIDDDILKRAKQVGTDWRELGNEWTRHFIDDMIVLNVRPPDYYPRATEVIPQIVEMDKDLIARGVAYESNGSVYFNVNSFAPFGALSHIPRPEMLPIANERGNRPDDPNKRDPLDFVLWQRQVDDEPGWPSPWGEGRPGWHIECSTMVNQLLGPSIDIHGGGADLIFPHHECEIAQSECATAVTPFARFWMHIAMVRKDGKKMSKSLGNLVMIADLSKQYSPDTIRLYLAGYHYRDSWEYHSERVEIAQAMAARWQAAAGIAGVASSSATPVNQSVLEAFRLAMEDDLDTPRAVALLDELASNINAGRYASGDEDTARATLRELAGVLGLSLGAAPDPRVAQGWGRHRRKFE